MRDGHPADRYSAGVFNNPRNLFVAGFIGTPQMNFFDAQLVREIKFFVDSASTLRPGSTVISSRRENHRSEEGRREQ